MLLRIHLVELAHSLLLTHDLETSVVHLGSCVLSNLHLLSLYHVSNESLQVVKHIIHLFLDALRTLESLRLINNGGRRFRSSQSELGVCLTHGRGPPSQVHLGTTLVHARETSCRMLAGLSRYHRRREILSGQSLVAVLVRMLRRLRLHFITFNDDER